MKTCLVFVAALAVACGSSKKEPAGPPQGGSIEPATAGSASTGTTAGSATETGTPPGAGSGSASTETGADNRTGSAAAAPAIEAAMIGGKTYKDLDKKGRAELMKKFVMPKARELFAEFDPKLEKVTCKTCHGAGVDDHTFKMPNPKIKPLPGTEKAFVEWVHQNPDEARWAGFMAQKLSPQIGQILGMTPFDPRTGKGDFSCEACHTMKK